MWTVLDLIFILLYLNLGKYFYKNYIGQFSISKCMLLSFTLVNCELLNLESPLLSLGFQYPRHPQWFTFSTA